MGHDFERRLVLAVRAHGYGTRTARMQELIREGLRETLDVAAGRARLDRPSWGRAGEVGGELAVLPPGEPESVVCDGFVHQVRAAVREHNRLTAADGRLRLRLAIHFGMTAGDAAGGFAGPGPVVARELAGCAAARDVLERGTAELVVIMSAGVVEDTVAGQLTSLEQRDLREVDAGGGRRAWLWLPGGDPWPEAPPTPEPTPEPEPAPEPGAASGGRPAGGPFADAHIIAGQVAGRDINNHFGDRA
ncbi:hypothetical protein DMB42_25530 [Nonomuraea sp. WAC 01424]|uniref:hypothetical protein n=1 Tax=Nonomuraea sp. WAC 01424 TaxID=2203200 RepID=UPI000F7B59F9|nr:hypothetical protein [Nonomuraea sp. WAC 01424]RSN06638.1 hypothetical protein DMB42_25530 [Nonomuraea sp. WAC 01424]